MPYKIKSHTRTQARKLGVSVKPSKVKGKKIDVFRNGKKIASVGAIGYNDYPTYKETRMREEDYIKKDIVKTER